MKHTYFFVFTFLCSVIGFNLSAQVYCIPPESTQGGPMTGFNNVTVGTLNNTSGADGYTDYTSTVAAVNLQRSSSYTPTFLCYHQILASGFSDRLNLRIWIDYNVDGDFNDAGEQVLAMQTPVLTSPTNNPVTGTAFLIPASATVGITRMRVFSDMLVSDGHDTPVPCGYLTSGNALGQHGEAEDYKVNITSATGVNELSTSPLAFSLAPNPTVNNSSISYTLANNTTITMEVFNIVGEKVTVLENGMEQAGTHTTNINVAELNLNSGIYFIVLTAGQITETRKLIVSTL